MCEQPATPVRMPLIKLVQMAARIVARAVVRESICRLDPLDRSQDRRLACFVLADQTRQVAEFKAPLSTTERKFRTCAFTSFIRHSFRSTVVKAKRIAYAPNDHLHVAAAVRIQKRLYDSVQRGSGHPIGGGSRDESVDVSRRDV